MPNGHNIKDILEDYRAKDADTQKVLDCIKILGNEMIDLKERFKCVDKKVMWLTVKMFSVLTAGASALTLLTWLITIWSK